MPSILVIDDEPMIRLTLRQAFEAVGFTVVEAENGRLGVEAYRRSPADLVVTDIIMPDQEGIETIITLRREFPDVKIIAMSGGGRIGSTDFLNRAREFGAVDVFEKPFRPKEMLRAVAEALV